MVTKTDDGAGLDVIPVLKRNGYDYAELSLSHICALSDAEFETIAAGIFESGLPIEACNNFFPASLKLTGRSVDISLVEKHLDRAFGRTAKLGVKVIVFGSGQSRMVPDGFPMDEAFDQLACHLRLISRYAVESGITIAVEALRKKECNIVNTYREALELADRADAPNIRCLLDFYHLNEESEDISVIEEGGSRLAHVHFAEPVGRVFPVQQNYGLYRDFLQQLKLAGYNQRISKVFL